MAAVGANTLENEQTRPARGGRGHTLSLHVGKGVHELTFPRLHFHLIQTCTRSWISSRSLWVVVATSAWQSPLFSNRNGYPKATILVLRRSQRDLSRGKDQGFDIRRGRAFGKIVWILKLLEIQCSSLMVGLLFFFLSFFKICDQSISCFDYVLEKRKEGLKSWFLENRDVFWRILSFPCKIFLSKDTDVYIYIFDSTRIYEASLWHGSKCIEWFLLPT